MDYATKELLNWGVAGVLVGFVLWYTKHLAMTVLPKLQDSYIATIIEAHKDCEARLATAYNEFMADRIERQRSTDRALDAMRAELERLNDRLSSFHPND